MKQPGMTSKASMAQRRPDTSPHALTDPPAVLSDELAAQFPLDPGITFLNHGSFGSCPRPVLAFQRQRQDIIEARPIEMLGRRSDEMLSEAKAVVGPFLGVKDKDFAFVTNATDAANAILRSLDFGPGDELLTTSHAYGAVRKTLHYVADRSGAAVIEADVSVPVADPAAVVRAIEANLAPRTKIVVIDHVTSPTALVFPVRDVVTLCQERNIDVLIDGAHAPGMIDLDIESLGAAFYIGNLHKWTCAPKGAGFIWVHPKHQRRVHPTVTSHYYTEGYEAEFSWQGTRDFTPWLAAAEAIRYLGSFGWERIRAHNHQLATWVQQRLCKTWNVPPTSPIDGSMLGSMATVPLPNQDIARRAGSVEKFGALLDGKHRIEIPIVDWAGTWWVRCSCQVYNTPQEYEKLAQAVLEEINALART